MIVPTPALMFPLNALAVTTPRTFTSPSTRTCPVRVVSPTTSRAVTEAIPPITLVATPEVRAKSASSAPETLRISTSA